MECQILFTGKNKKNIIDLSFAENAHRVVKVKHVYNHMDNTICTLLLNFSVSR